jgi:D-hexose-6-phosphate mutarotase
VWDVDAVWLSDMLIAMLRMMQVTVSQEGLKQTLELENVGSDELPFTIALHTYFKVSSIDKVCSLSLLGYHVSMMSWSKVGNLSFPAC